MAAYVARLTMRLRCCLEDICHTIVTYAFSKYRRSSKKARSDGKPIGQRCPHRIRFDVHDEKFETRGANSVATKPLSQDIMDLNNLDGKERQLGQFPCRMKTVYISEGGVAAFASRIENLNITYSYSSA